MNSMPLSIQTNLPTSLSIPTTNLPKSVGKKRSMSVSSNSSNGIPSHSVLSSFGMASYSFDENQSPTSQKRAERYARSGKWTLEEENFANRLIVEFEAGSLDDCEDGCTLRSYLARRLRCAPMRISKKFAGRCIGKLVFARRPNIEPIATVGSSLSELELLYHKSYQTRSSTDEDDSTSFNNSIETASYNSTNSSTDEDHYGYMQHSESYNDKRRRFFAKNNNNIPLSFDENSAFDYESPDMCSSPEDMLYAVNLLDEDGSVDPNQINDTINGNNCNNASNNLLEAEEWLDVLSFFCGPTERDEDVRRPTASLPVY